MTDPGELVSVLRHLVAGDPDGAREVLATVTASPLADALSRHLAAAGDGSVYDDPAGFDAFISHGSNPGLYSATIEHLRGVHGGSTPSTVMDIGCGDGRVTAAVLSASTSLVDLVEPSAALLAEALASVRSAVRSVERRGHGVGIVEHLRAVDDDVRWDLVQSTFALHTLRPEERAEVLVALSGRARRLVVVDFDVPALDPAGDAWLGYLVERYTIGVAEYADHPAAIDGFLVPVLVGQLDPARPRHTFEQPAAAWARDLVDAGFVEVDVTPVSDYWWAPAVAVSGSA